MPPAKTNALRLLEAASVTYHTLSYTYQEDDLSLDKIAADNNLSISQVFKTLVTKGDKTGIVIAVISGDSMLDLKYLAKASGNKKMALVPVKDLQKETGYIRGGCSPIGMKRPFPVFLEEKALMFETIYINAGTRGLLLAVAPSDLLEITGGSWL